MELAPLRSMDEFILSKSRFQMPNVNDEERWFNRVVYNLMYYQTNYLLSSLVIFSLVFFYRPQEMCVGVLLMGFSFAFSFFLQEKKAQVKQFKREHPILVTLIAMSVGYYLIYKLSSVAVFLLGVALPILFTMLHASFRLRNTMNKLANVTNVLGLSKRTPMGMILESVGIEPNFKYQ